MGNRLRFTGVFLLALIVFLIAFPFATDNPYFLRIGITLFLLTPLALGVALLARSGQLTFAQYAFFGVGAYAAAILTTRLGWSWWVCLPIAGVVAGAISVLIGYPALKIKGPYFSILTFGVNEILRLIWTEWESLTGGSKGIAAIPPPGSFFGFAFEGTTSFYFLGLGLMLVCAAAIYRIDRSRFGLTLASTGQADLLAESVGVNARAYKLRTFAAICFFAGVMGAFFASLQRYISPLDFQVWESFNLVVFCVVGGMGSFFGPVYGIVALTIIPVLLQYVPGYDPVYQPIFYGALVLAIVILYPSGIAALVASVSKRLARA